MSSTKPVLRCQHVKVNGVQCGSPALRDHRRCYFHDRWERIDPMHRRPHSALGDGVLPALEDANSIQLALAEVMRLSIMGHIEYRVFALLLRALRIASANLKHMSPTPQPTHMVIDPESVENRPLGATAWSEAEGKDYDMIDTVVPDAPSTPVMSALDEAMAKSYQDLVAGVARDPDFLTKTDKHNEANSAPERIVTKMIPWNEWNQMSDDAKRALESAGILTP
jgi:hypothetical protein